MNSINEIVSRLKENRNHVMVESDYDERAYRDFVKEVMDNSTWKKVDKLCRDHGYKLAPLSYVDVAKNGKRKLQVIINTLSDDKGFFPEIYIKQVRGSEKVEYEIATVAYGSLNMVEYREFVDNVTSAKNLVEELRKIDLFDLYNSEEEE